LASATLHHGEEPPISGTRGSGTLFFSHCPLHCVFCQNWPISQRGVGEPIDLDALAGRMVALERRGAHNINLVNPTHYWAQIAAAVWLARRRGLTIPVLANSNGFESIDTLALLDEIVQIWMPDLKYVDADLAAKYSGSRRLPEASWKAVRWLHRRRGPLRLGPDGLAVGGVFVRHLALPGAVGQTRAAVRRMARLFGRRLTLSLMTQYFPAYKAHQDPLLHRPLHDGEKRRVRRLGRRLRLRGGWRQDDG
jgi:putative pyruvate formate lyase activating enzyme